MILTVTPNPALDVTYVVDRLTPHGEHRVREVLEMPGGKGLNVARVLHTLGEAARTTGLTMGSNGEAIRARLAEFGIDEAFIHSTDATPQRQSRRTVVVVDEAHRSTSFWEPGPAADENDVKSLLDAVREHAASVRAIAVCGSSPPGVPADLAAQIADCGRQAGVPVIVDTSGPGLRLAAETGAVLKPNTAELADALGRPLDSLDDVVAACRGLVAQGTPAVVVTRGAQGAVAVTQDRAWRSTPPVDVRGNATGAGDAFTAALARRIADAESPFDVDWCSALREATALSAAAVLRSVAGEVDIAAYHRWVNEVEVEEI